MSCGRKDCKGCPPCRSAASARLSQTYRPGYVEPGPACTTCVFCVARRTHGSTILAEIAVSPAIAQGWRDLDRELFGPVSE